MKTCLLRATWKWAPLVLKTFSSVFQYSPSLLLFLFLLPFFDDVIDWQFTWNRELLLTAVVKEQLRLLYSIRYWNSPPFFSLKKTIRSIFSSSPVNIRRRNQKRSSGVCWDDRSTPRSAPSIGVTPASQKSNGACKEGASTSRRFFFFFSKTKVCV